MKKLLLALGLAVLVAGSAQAVSVAVVAPSAVSVSAIYVIEVTVEGALEAEGAKVINVYLSWTHPPTQVGYEGGAPGDFIEQQAGELFEFESYNNTAGYASYAVARRSTDISTGSGTAATLTFHCMGPGLAVITYDT